MRRWQSRDRSPLGVLELEFRLVEEKRRPSSLDLLNAHQAEKSLKAPSVLVMLELHNARVREAYFISQELCDGSVGWKWDNPTERGLSWRTPTSLL
ncbi:hypothetical protein Q4I32_003037 [Leishmania shawi]|uniref:Uncharacterized protein n=1 Tax=Leishmania shawi TaxID=5680 RepID=A0AAW3BWB2_9TRYP